MDWIALITTFLMPIWAKCQENMSSETPAEYLADHYDATTGKMDPGIVRDAMPGTRRAIRKALRATPQKDRGEFPRYSRDEIYVITEKKLIEAMNAPPEAVAAAKAVAATLGDD